MMRRIIVAIVAAFAMAACKGSDSAASNADFEGLWSGNGISLQFSAANLVWREGGGIEKIYTFSASYGDITITDRGGETYSGTYSFSSDPARLTLYIPSRLSKALALKRVGAT